MEPVLRAGLLVGPMLWLSVLTYKPVYFVFAAPVSVRLKSISYVDQKVAGYGVNSAGRTVRHALLDFEVLNSDAPHRGSCLSPAGNDDRAVLGFAAKVQALDAAREKNQVVRAWHARRLGDVCIYRSWPWGDLGTCLFLLATCVALAFSPASPLNSHRRTHRT
jgi:hypothetical protein